MPRKGEVISEFETAEDLFNQGKYEEAINYYDKVILIESEFSKAWLSKGLALQNLGKNEEAIICYDKCIEINPRNSWPWNNKGSALINLGKYDEAIGFLEKSIEIAPKNSLPWSNKGIALRHLGKFEDAIECFDKCIELHPRDSFNWAEKGQSLLCLYKYGDAVISFNQAINLSPDNSFALLGKGQALYFLGNFKEALVNLEKALEVDPDDEDAWLFRGEALGALGNYKDAVECYDHVIEKNPRAHWAIDRRLEIKKAMNMPIKSSADEPLEATRKEPLEIESAENTTGHDEIQWILLNIGSEMGLDVYVARNDRSKEYKGIRFDEIPGMQEEIPRQFDDKTNKIVGLIDVLWLKGKAILAAFEIESTTSVYSGLLRMSDLISMQPNLNIPIYIVAPDNRKEKVLSEINRPVFSNLSPPLNEICKFIPFSCLKKQFMENFPMLRYLRPKFLENISENL